MYSTIYFKVFLTYFFQSFNIYLTICFLQAQQKNKQSLELSKFLHFYTKFKKHEVTRQMEELFVEIVKNWRIALSTALNIPEGDFYQFIIKINIIVCLIIVYELKFESFVDDERTKFVEDAVVEVQKAKRVLCASYVYGFYMQSSAYNRNILDFMQVKFKNIFFCKILK